MAYLTATRYGLEHVEPTEQQRASGWRQVWRHPSGALAMRHPSDGRWVVSMDGIGIEDEGWCSSLRGAARKIERALAIASDQNNAPRRNPHGMSRKQKYALILLEEASPGVVTTGPTALLDGQTWIHWRTAESLVARGFVRIVGEGEAAEVVWA